MGGSAVQIGQSFNSIRPGAPSPTGFALDPSSGELYQDTGLAIYHYAADCNLLHGLCDPLDTFGAGQLSESLGVAVDGATHTVYVADAKAGNVAVFSRYPPSSAHRTTQEIGETAVPLPGTPIPKRAATDRADRRMPLRMGPHQGLRPPVSCEQPTPYRLPKRSPPSSPVSPRSPTCRSAPSITTASSRQTRGATAEGEDQTAGTTAPPLVEGISCLPSHRHLRPARRDDQTPTALPTTCRFQYGTTTAYGQTLPRRPKSPATPSNSAEPRKGPISPASSRRHLPLPPHRRKPTGHQPPPKTRASNSSPRLPQLRRPPADRLRLSPRLPRLRARLPRQRQRHPALPRRPQHRPGHQPLPLLLHRRLSAPCPATDTDRDHRRPLRRHPHRHRLGLPLRRPPRRPGRLHGRPARLAQTPATSRRTRSLLTDTVLTDPSMSRFLDFIDGGPIECYGAEVFIEGDYQARPRPPTPPTSSAAEGALAGRLPDRPRNRPRRRRSPQLPLSPQTTNSVVATAPAKPPPPPTSPTSSSPPTTSPFRPNGGLTAAPGSAYDDDLATGKLALISKLADGQPIPQARLRSPPNHSSHSKRARQRRRVPPLPRRLHRRLPHPHLDRRPRRTSSCAHASPRRLGTSQVPALHRYPRPPLHARRRRRHL